MSSEPDEFGHIVLTMPQKLHRHGGLNILIGPASISKELLSKENLTNNEKIAGRTLLQKAKDVVATCKKTMGLVTASGSPYRDGTFPSGTNWDGYVKWCHVTMQNDCNRDVKMKLSNAAVTTESVAAMTTKTCEGAGAAATTMRMTETTAATTQLLGNDDDGGASEQHPFPVSGSFLIVGVGFLAWALWGHIPFHDGEQMLSHLFSNVKASALFGRGTSTRSAMRKALFASCAAPVENYGERNAMQIRFKNLLPTMTSSYSSLDQDFRAPFCQGIDGKGRKAASSRSSRSRQACCASQAK